jgi:CRP/FNR family transcriptional regulator, anaerobic regulatory protein
MPVENVFSLINSIIPVSHELNQKLAGCLKAKTFKRKDHLLKEDNVCNYIYFIEKGLVRSYYLKDGNEICSWFMKEGDVIISVASFFSRKPSYESLQALEDTTVHFIHFDELQEIYKEFIEFNIVGRVLTEKYYQLSEERLFSLRHQTAAERLNYLNAHHPDILQRVNRGYIASYLGVTPETLSRINKKI